MTGYVPYLRIVIGVEIRKCVGTVFDEFLHLPLMYLAVSGDGGWKWEMQCEVSAKQL